MTETKKTKKFILRRLVVAALVMAMVFALAMGANAATNGELFKSVITMVTYSEDGETITMTVNDDAFEDADSDAPKFFTIEDKGSGKGHVVYKDKDGNTVTQEFELPNDIDGSVIPEEDIETEAAQAAELQEGSIS